MKNRLILTFVSLFFATLSFSQDNDFPAFNYFRVEANLGNAAIGGDVVPNRGFTVGLNLEKSFNRFFSLRANYNRYSATGLNYYQSQITSTSSRTLSELGYTNTVQNHFTRLNSLSIDPMLTFKGRRFGVYLALGANFHWYNVFYDAFNENGQLYDFTALNTAIATRGDVSRDDLEIVRSILDGSYDTSMLTDKNFEAAYAFGLNIALGVNYQITNNIHIGLELNSIASLNDNLDGHRGNSTSDAVGSLRIVGGYTFR